MSAGPDPDEMRASPARIQTLAENLASVLSRINAVAAPDRPVRLVAVSKLKPASDVLALYNATGHRHFGENYSQELFQKASTLPSQINWHFIGQLQTNKCKQLAEKIPNLWAVESVDSVKKADALEKGRAALMQSSSSEVERLRVYVQVNTSDEPTKSGLPPPLAASLATHITTSCPHLQLQGLMTIGSAAASTTSAAAAATATITKNPDFQRLFETRREVYEALKNVEGGGELELELELSMGMSADFEEAVGVGSGNVRVGTVIFGERPKKVDVVGDDGSGGGGGGVDV